MSESTQSKKRRLRQFKELFHQMMIVIPFFYSSEPTTLLAVRCKTNLTFAYEGKYVVQEKLYYQGSKPKITQIVCFTDINQSKKIKEEIQQTYIQNNKKYFCYYCKDISDYAGTLFQIGSVYVTNPESKELKQIINDIAQLVIVDGITIEYALKKQAQYNPFLSFLRQHALSIQNIYYRWRVYSFLMGDGEKKYRTDSYQMIKNGSIWHPPLISNQSQPLLVLNVKKVLYFTQILEKIKRKKYCIQEAMIFCVHNTNYAPHIISIIAVQLIQNLRKDFIGYFFLLSDILFNSTTFQYRDLIQAILPYIIYQYVFIIQNSKDNQIEFKYIAQIRSLLQIWERKYLFQENFIKGVKIMLTLTQRGKIYKLKSLNDHIHLRQILEHQDFQYELENKCKLFGIPYFEEKKQQAKLFLNYYFWQNDLFLQTEPSIGKYDGQPLNQKDLAKIKLKQVNVNCCQSISLLHLDDSNWKNNSLDGKSWQYSQDYQ